MMKKIVSFIFIALIIIPLLSSQVHAVIPAPFTAGQHVYQSQAAGRGYLLYLPKSYDQNSSKKWPLIVHLHGLGVGSSNVEMGRLEALPQMLESKSDFGAIVFSPVITGKNDEAYWTSTVPESYVIAVMDELISKLKIDPSRIYLTGYSLGGGGTWGLGLKYHQRFAALVPVAGFYGTMSNHTTPTNICDLKNTPIWAFHGALDTTIPLAEEEKLINAVKACQGNAKLTIFPDQGHNISSLAHYNNQELFTWLFAQSKGGSYVPPASLSPSIPPSPSANPSNLPAMPADANNDGQVDGDDYVIWVLNYGKNVLGTVQGDFNQSGKVDGDDYVIWLLNYGE